MECVSNWVFIIPNSNLARKIRLSNHFQTCVKLEELPCTVWENFDPAILDREEPLRIWKSCENWGTDPWSQGWMSNVANSFYSSEQFSRPVYFSLSTLHLDYSFSWEILVFVACSCKPLKCNNVKTLGNRKIASPFWGTFFKSVNLGSRKNILFLRLCLQLLMKTRKHQRSTLRSLMLLVQCL